MKKLIFSGVILLYSSLSKSQDTTIVNLKNNASIVINKDVKDTCSFYWKKGGNGNINLNQGSMSNWSAGGDKFSFSINAYSNFFAFYKKEKNT
jgi:hypothetical protein